MQHRKRGDPKPDILKLFSDDKNFVAYDREIRYRLEDKYPHDMIGQTLKELERERKLLHTSLPGRRSRSREGYPNKFYRLPDSDWKSQLPLMRKKLELSLFVSQIMPEMGSHAETAWWRAFKRNGWEVKPDKEEEIGGIREYNGKESTLKNDLDFIAIKDDIAYGVEVKNGLTYPDDLYFKCRVAAEIGTIPLVIARWLNPRQINIMPTIGAQYIVYREALISSTFEPIVSTIKQVLQYPIITKDEVDDEYFKKSVSVIHEKVRNNFEQIRQKLDKFLSVSREDTRLRKSLGEKHT